MVNKLYGFRCKNTACTDKTNFVELDEDKVEHANKRTRYLLYCGECGVCVTTEDRDVDIDNNGQAWLFCIEFKGPEKDLTTGPISHPKYGYLWGDAAHGNLTERDFMELHGVNARVEWCNRRRKNDPNYKHICTGKGKIEPVNYGPFPPKQHPKPVFHPNLAMRRIKPKK